MPVRPSPSVSRAIEVLELLARRPRAGLTLSAIARELSMNKTTCQGVLLALAERGCVVRSPVTLGYSLGPGLLSLGNAARSDLQTVAAAEALAVALSAELGVACNVVLLVGEHLVIAGSVNVRSPFRTGTAGIQTVPFRPPIGAPLVAWSDDRTVDDWLARADPPLSATERTHYLRALQEIRGQGFGVTIYQPDLAAAIAELAVDPGSTAAQQHRDQAFAGLGHAEYLAVDLKPRRRYPIGDISAPVFDHDSRPSALVVLTGFPMEMDLASMRVIGTRINTAVRQLTRDGGGVWPSREPSDGRSSEVVETSPPAPKTTAARRPKGAVGRA